MDTQLDPQLDARLQQIAASSAATRLAQYRSELQAILLPAANGTHSSSSNSNSSSNNMNRIESQLRTFVVHAVADAVGLVGSRALLGDFISLFATHAQSLLPQERAMAVWRFALDRMLMRAVAFEEQISLTRERIAELLEADEEWSLAAKMLQEIPLDSGHRAISNDYKLKIYIHIVRLLLEDEDAVSAESYLNRCALLLPDSTDEQMQLLFKASQARMLDFRRNFLQAASKYLELSYVPILHDSERIGMLVQAATCTILAGAGPQRTRMLATLYKDERIRERVELKQGGIDAMLEKMYLGRVLRASEVEGFAKTLRPHQLATLANDMTVLDRAVIEHNLLSASRLYKNISFAELGGLLAISPDLAEQVATRMIGENRLTGSIDRVDQLIFFTSSDVLPTWDTQVSGVCYQLDGIIDLLREKHPEWTARTLAR
eukprot:jgi/Hompol1/4567/HPOL_003708-RA